MASPYEAYPHVRVPFEIRGGSPFVFRVMLSDVPYELVISPHVTEIEHVVGAVNQNNPGMPVFRIQTQTIVTTRKGQP